MRVLLVGARPPPTGGVATHVREIAGALAEIGVEVSLVDPRRRGPDGWARLLSSLTVARARGDLIHLHTNGHNHGSWALAALCAGPRSLLTLHSGLAPKYIAGHRWTRSLAARFRQVIAVNDEIARAIGDSVVLPAWTPRSLAFRIEPPGLSQLRARHRPLLACALAPGREYGAQIVLEAFCTFVQRHPRAGLLLYGPGTQSLRAQPNVALLGELSRERALAVIAACDIFVRPTLADGDAVSVREALALGRIVVASSVGNRPAGTLTFPAGSAAACAELLFLAAERASAPPPDRVDDGLPALLKIYESCGVHALAVPVGTGLAI